MTVTSSDSPDRENPLIIAEPNHPIRPEMIDKDAVYVMRKLNRAGFSSYLVGGGVRDLYLGRLPKDYDISTDARPGQIRKLFSNSQTIGRRFRLVQVFFKGGKVVEVSTLRSLSEHDIEGPEAVLAPNNTYGSLPDDAQRRDLSINSLFYELENRTIIDYVGGVSDLDRSIIRITGNPDKRITRDPVRMIRAIRHSARTGFTMEEETWRSIVKNHDKISLCPSSRIRDELFKDLSSGCSAPWFDPMVQSGLFTAIFPFYKRILYKTTTVGIPCTELLANTFNLIDSLHSSPDARRKPLPKQFVLALLMLPWADVTHSLPSLKLKGPAYFQLSKRIRTEIDELLGIQLNLRKSIRQEIVTLLCNLPQFVRFVQNNSIPKWLKKKSYYQKCLYFHELYNNTINGKTEVKTDEQTILETPTDEESLPGGKNSHKRKMKPAFSPKKKGGVFGFRKR